MKVLKNIIMASVIMLCVPEVNADDQATQKQLVNVGLNTGFTGTNIEVSKVLNDYLSLRADMFISGSVSGSSTLEGNEFAVSFTPDTKSLYLMCTHFPVSFILPEAWLTKILMPP